MDVENMMKLRTLSWGAYSGFSKWAQSNHMDSFFFFFHKHTFILFSSFPAFLQAFNGHLKSTHTCVFAYR